MYSYFFALNYFDNILTRFDIKVANEFMFIKILGLPVHPVDELNYFTRDIKQSIRIKLHRIFYGIHLFLNVLRVIQTVQVEPSSAEAPYQKDIQRITHGTIKSRYELQLAPQ
jgi:hypothetical protein